ncbi:MAG: hypothetical protein QNJ54_02795 [Prochloraceae cyanobacterium]|nr:hypothetical protein [Prochloraceae cyanobacterium]
MTKITPLIKNLSKELRVIIHNIHTFELPSDHLPQEFTIDNACVSNSQWVWMRQYLYS